MTWVAWRQHRNELIIMLAILAGLAAYLVPVALERHDLFRDSGLQACLQAGGACPDLRFQLVDSYNSVNNIVGWFNFVPGIVGLLLALPIVAEFEQRTYRLAWTQSITRERWLATRVGMAIGGVALFAVPATLLMTWSYAPFDQSETLAGRDLGQSFDFEGAMPFSYTLFAFALTLAAGAVSRRVPVAMAVGLVGFIALRLSVMELLRQGITSSVEMNAAPGQSLVEYTRDMGRFWATQATEAAIFLSAASVLLAVTLWLVKRRIA